MRGKMVCFGIMVLGLVACATACGKKKGDEALSGKSAQREWVYAAERVEIPDSGVDYTKVRLVGDTVCYFTDELAGDGGEDDSEGIKGSICKYSITDKKLDRTEIAWEDGCAIHQPVFYVFDAEGNAWLIVNSFPARYSYGKRFLYRFDADGKVTLCRELTEQHEWVTDMALDNQGRIYVFDRWKGVWLYDANGAFCGCIEWENSKDVQALGAAAAADGKLYTCLRKDQSVEKSTLVEVDFAEKKVIDIATEIPQMRGICSAGEGAVCLFDETKVYRYSLADNKLEEVFPWSDGDINGYCVYQLGSLPEEAFLCSVMDWASDEKDVVLFQRCKAEELPPRADLVLALVKENEDLGEYLSAKRMGQAVQLSRNSTRYHITIQKYDSLTNLYRALLTGEQIDLIDLSGIQNGVNVASLCRQGILEDMSPYLEQSERLSEESFVEGVLEAYYYGDQLVGIPDSFRLRTLAGDKSQLKNPKGLDLSEFYELSKSMEISKNSGTFQNPDGKLLVESLDGVNRADMLRYLLLFNEETFIDWEKKECQFNTEEFRQILELAAGFPEQVKEYTMGDVPQWKIIEDGGALFAMADLDHLKSFQTYEHAYGENAGFVGFPTPDGEGGTLLIAGDAFGILAKSGHKEEAWAFIEDFLCRQDLENVNPEELYTSYVSIYAKYPARKDILQYLADFLMTREAAKGVSGSSDGGFLEPDFRVLTKEDIYAVMELLPSARPYFSEEGDEVLKIVSEEAGAYFAGQKTFEEVAELVQNRVKLYVQEQDFVQPKKREKTYKPFILADNGNIQTAQWTDAGGGEGGELVNPVIAKIAEANRIPLEEIADAQPGDIVLFGSYEQDYDMENGKEPIEWYVLENAEGQVTLLSVYLLDYKCYNEKREDTTWEKCTLRAWLNKDFLTTAFTKEEQKRLVTTRLTNADNPVWGTKEGSKGGKDTEDKVWLLSLEDVERYLHIPVSASKEKYDFETERSQSPWTSDDIRESYEMEVRWFNQDYRIVSLPTAYLLESYREKTGEEYYRPMIKDGKVAVDEWVSGMHSSLYSYEIGGGRWWLRSPGRWGAWATRAGWSPIPNSVGDPVDSGMGVRPVVKVAY